ncbi:class I SAM-dependent DNA methyltransferase [Flavobacterium sp. N3904]|uniref:class I SAM-dependent DNA methyltransferase n=1 Tax=Flavobacterium sp. N3904 TaxID=2986835 RepID=UPI002224156C|nr:DNA methyltransferase [Flavobacterium sp. N3904]
MTLSWNEIKDRAVKFSKEWADTKNEEADAKPFLVEFFNVFGINRKKVASFEHRVKKLDEKDGYIDLLWKATILVEMKSRGKNLDKAYQQARDYLHGLKQHELPKYILISDFDIFRLYDIEEDTLIEFKLDDFVNNVQHFGYIIGYQKKVYKEQDPANIKAAELMGKLHDRLKEIGYTGHSLEVYLVRLLFCLFAEDTTIFNKQQFQDYIDLRSNEDGSDLAPKLQELFQVLNTANDKRFKNLDEQLNEFPYVNGKLFEEILPTASFDTKMRQALLDCCYIDWSKISPAIFGSMFQSVMNPQERRNLGAHYTSETNILKLIKPLFLDELWKEFESVKTNKNKLPEFHKKISELKFLDPACGCGNFLVITYRELRLLEIEILRATYKSGQGVLDIREIIWLDVDMMCGIEYEEFPARIAEVAMWLIDHQMNMLISNEFGQYFARLPLKKSAKIVHGDALEVNWEDVISKDKLSYIIGNPPFIGSKIMSQLQRNQIVKEFDNIQGSGVLDYVAGWYIKSAKYIQNTTIRVAFVSTNSIVQGEQTSILWGQMLNKYNIKIHFAHRTFRWSNEAKGNAAVYCVIVGFANYDTKDKIIFEYEDIKGEPHEIRTKNINPYLVDGKEILINKRSNPICNIPIIKFGNQPIDGGFLLFNEEEKNSIIDIEPFISKYIRKFVGSVEFINNIPRYCLWLKDAEPSDLSKSKFISERLKEVKKFRESSTRKETRELATRPSQFAFVSHNESEYIIIPSVSSEKRKYIPLGFMPSNEIASNLCLIIPNAKMFHFGILTSEMHMSWVRTLCGRLKSDYRYSNSIVYNNFPWPENPSDKQIKAIEEKAQKVLDVRTEFPKSSLADLYSPLTMPPALIKAHNELDKAVDTAYSKQNFTSDAKRMEFLFELYEKYTSTLFTKEKVKKTKKTTLLTQ